MTCADQPFRRDADNQANDNGSPNGGSARGYQELSTPGEPVKVSRQTPELYIYAWWRWA